jgi:hypothetical protein
MIFYLIIMYFKKNKIIIRFHKFRNRWMNRCQVLCLDYLTCLEFYFEVLLNMLEYAKYYV